MIMWGELPTGVSEPIRAEAESSLDESAIFSDDTGFFSGEDVYNSSEDVEGEEQEQEDYRLDQRELKLIDDFCNKDYLKLDETSCFSIKFETLVELIRKVARALDLVTGATLLEVAIVLIRRQIAFVQRFVQDMAFTSLRLNRRNRGPGNPLNPDLESPGPSARIREIADNSARTRNLSIRLANADSQIVMNFDEIPVDVTARKLFIRKRLNGLVSNTLLDFEFDIHSLYNSEYSSVQLPMQGNFDGGVFLKHLKGISAREKTDSTIHFYDIDSQYDYENDTAIDEHSEDSLFNQTDFGACGFNESMSDSAIMNEEIPQSVGMDESEETENQAPPHDVSLAPANLHEVPVGIVRRKRRLQDKNVQGKRRKPFEALNEAEPEIMRDTDGDDARDFEPTMPTNDLHADLNSIESMIVDVDPGYYSQSTMFSDVDNDSLDINDDHEINDHDGQVRVPSPIFGKEAAATTSLIMTPQNNVDIHDVISTMQITLESEITEGDISIEDVLRQANFNIKGAADESTSSTERPAISLHTILVANLHAVVNLGLYLQPTDDGSFVITKTKPDALNLH